MISPESSQASSSSKEHPRIEFEPARALRSGVQIARRGGDVPVPERRLHLRKRGVAIDRVACVGVAQPVRRDRRLKAGPGRCALHRTEHRARCKRTALKAQLEEMVRADHRTLASYIELVLENHARSFHETKQRQVR